MEQQIQHAINLVSSGNVDKALVLLKELNQKNPENGKIFEVMGHCFLAKGENDQALIYLEKALQLLPDSANIAAYLGGTYHALGGLDKAIHFFTQAVGIDPSYHQAWHFLSLIYFQLKDITQGLAHLQKANETDPFVQAITQAQTYLNASQVKQAQQLCQQVLKQHRSHPRALALLATIAINNGQLEEAQAYLQNALNYSPYDSPTLTIMAQLQAQLRQYENAEEASKKLLEIYPEDPKHWQIYADILLNAGKYQLALQGFERAYELSGNEKTLLLQRAHIKKIIGNSNAALQDYLHCSISEKTRGSAFWALANTPSFHFSDEQISDMESMQLDPDTDPEQACQAAFALAKHYEDNGDHEKAFRLYRSANMNRSGGQFVPTKYQSKCASLINTFTPELLAKSETGVVKAIRPIFVVGLPRSGSTLIEQILASHSQIEGTMELKILPEIARRLFIESCRKNGNASGSLETFSPKELIEFGHLYMSLTEIYRSDSPFFIDKLPPNFQHIGLIKLILPQAIIIDARRQPLACGLGIYKQYFGHGHDFSYDLKHIGFYYNQYLRLMDHWQATMPKQILTLQHEELVADTENQVNSLLAHCELKFEPQCLDFHLNKRAVRTASSEQVRQPINSKGLDLWKQYRTHLTPLIDELGEATVQRFSRWID